MNVNTSVSRTPHKKGILSSYKTPKKTPISDRYMLSRNHMDIESTQLSFRESMFNSRDNTYQKNSVMNGNTGIRSSMNGVDKSPSRSLNSNQIGYTRAPCSPNTAEYNQSLKSALFNKPEAKILAFKAKAPAPREGHLNNLRVVYSQNKYQKGANTANQSSRKVTRRIPQIADKILDAPALLDDYYLNLLSWSQTSNVLAVALGSSVYLWNAESGSTEKLLTTDNEEPVTSISWIQEGNIIAVGTDSCTVQLWDASAQKRLRTMRGHVSRVGSLAWNTHLLSSGSKSGQIHTSDVRIENHLLSNITDAHAQDVCGLSWSMDGTQLASGGNDNILNIWDINSMTDSSSNNRNNTNLNSNFDNNSMHSGIAPRFSLMDHQAAVKALAWCPWQSNLLASGGGTADRKIKFWNTTTGKCLNSIDTNSQVCSLLWNKQHREIISSHGFSQNQLCIWKYPTMNKVAELTGHTSRVLHMAMSPDGETVVSAAGDETLRFWKCFASDSKVKSQGGLSNSHHSGYSKKSSSNSRSTVNNYRMIR